MFRLDLACLHELHCTRDDAIDEMLFDDVFSKMCVSSRFSGMPPFDYARCALECAYEKPKPAKRERLNRDGES